MLIITYLQINFISIICFQKYIIHNFINIQIKQDINIIVISPFQIEIKNIVTERGTQRVKSMIYNKLTSNLIIGYLNGSVSIYNIEQKKQINEKLISSSAIRGLSLICNDQGIIAGDDKGILYLIDANTLQKRLQFYAHLDAIRAVVTHPQNQNLVFTSGDDATIRVWFFENANKQPQLLAELISEDNSPITSLTFDIVGNRLISTQNHFVKIYDTSVFQDITDFKQKVEQGKIGSVNIQTQSIIDQLNIKNLEKLGQYALNSVTNYVTGSQQQKEIKIEKALTSLTAMYSIRQENQFSCAIWISGNVLSDLTQENPYSNGQLQYIAAGTGDNQIQIIDSYSKQQIKSITLGNGSDAISQLLQVDDFLIATSNDNFVYFVDIKEMKVEKQLNYQMERSWCGCTSKYGASNILGLGFDQGYVVLQVGDVEAKVAVYQQLETEKIRICCQSERTQFDQKQSEINCQIGKKLYFSNKIADSLLQNENSEFKEIDRNLNVKSLNYTPNGKFIAIQQENNTQICSALTGKEKGLIKSKDVCWKQDFQVQKFNLQKVKYEIETDDKSLFYCILNEKSFKVVNVYDGVGDSDNQAICSIYADNTVNKLIQGPIVTIIEQGCVQFFTYEDGLFVSQIDIQVQNVKWSKSGELCALIAEDAVYVLKFNFNEFIEGIQDENYDESVGIENVFEQLFSIQMEISDVQFSVDSQVMLVQQQQNIYQIWIQEAIKFENIETTELEIPHNQNIVMLQMIELEGKNYLVYMYNEKQQSQYNITFLVIDTSLQEFKTLVNEQKIDQAIDFVKQWNDNETKLIAAAEYLNNVGQTGEVIEQILNDENIIFKYACQNNNIDMLIKYQEHDKQIVANKCFEYGSIISAQKLYEELQDYPMTTLCAYINGDQEKLEELEQQENINDNLKNQIKLILDEDIQEPEKLFENNQVFTTERLQLVKQFIQQLNNPEQELDQEFKDKFKAQLNNIGLRDLADEVN